MDRTTAGIASAKDRDIETILDEWQHREPSIKLALVRFERYQYDTVFGIEKRANVVLHFEPRERYLWTLKPAAIKEGTLSQRRTAWGKRFVVEADTPESIRIQRECVMMVNPVGRTYGLVELPRGDHHWTFGLCYGADDVATDDWPGFFAPFGMALMIRSQIDLQASLLTGTQIEQLREAFEWSFSEKEREGLISLTAKPAILDQQRQFKRIDVLLDADSYRTKGVRFIDTAGTCSMVLVPQSEAFNDGVEPVRFPSLRGYKLLSFGKEETPQPQEATGNEWPWWSILIQVVQYKIGFP